MSNSNCCGGSTTPPTNPVTQLKQSCGCATPTPIVPENLVSVPPGSTIVQAPCAEACLPDSSANPGLTDPATGTNCDNLKNPCILANFTVPDIGATGQMLATCASSWAIPGTWMYFSAGYYLEVVGVSGDVITYKNLTIPFGTQLLEGVCFNFGPPDLENAPSEGDGGDPSTTLDEIWGIDNGRRANIQPVDGTMIVACGGKWQRRSMGQMFYPTYGEVYNIEKQQLNTGNQRAFPGTLPSFPSAWECGQTVHAVIHAKMSAFSIVNGQMPNYYMYVNGGLGDRWICSQHSAGDHFAHVHGTTIVPCNSANMTVLVRNVDQQNANGQVNGIVWCEGYFI